VIRPSGGAVRYVRKLVSAYEGYHPRRAALLFLALVCAALLFAGSMPLPWHHQVLAKGGGYAVVNGIDGASWLIAVAVAAIIFLIRCISRPPGTVLKWLFTIATFLVVLGMFNDYINWQSRAAQPKHQVQAYFGPGFYVALAGIAVLVLANVPAWRLE
jgi:amino acid transporter